MYLISNKVLDTHYAHEPSDGQTLALRPLLFTVFTETVVGYAVYPFIRSFILRKVCKYDLRTHVLIRCKGH